MIRREDGAAILIVVLAIVAIFGMVVLTVDVGGLMWKRRMMVRASDAAALAAAQSCALTDAGEVALAPSRADQYATSNVSDATRLPGADGYQVGPSGAECGTASSGWVGVGYESPFAFIFAPILGAPQQRTVSAQAVALWGPAGGAGSIPLEIPLSAFQGTIPCVEGDSCNFWWDNSADFDPTGDSNWGWIGLEPEQWPSSVALNDPGRSCPAVANSDTTGWLTDGGVEVTLQGVPTYVCRDSGRGGAAEQSLLFEALSSLVDPEKIWYIPVNDPDQMVLTSGKEKYAIVGFVGMKILDVLEGDDPAAAGTPPTGGDCTTTKQMTTGGTLDLVALSGGGCPNGTTPDSITALELTKGNGANATTFVGCSDTIPDTTG
ncbi:MAG TPA: pilus assembly protein TadG-related protein, partial [Actinomycetota bacterium]|nr:pilus assembly protein TadG-related protein [Actinomycetota bacterium]